MRPILRGKALQCILFIALAALAFAAMTPKPDAPPAGLPADAWQAIRAAVERDRYAARTNPEGELEAVNPAQAYRIRFTSEGITVRPHGDGFELGLRLERWGYGELLEAVPTAEPVADGPRVTYVRGGLQEWYVNRPTGLEQGFTVTTAPRRATDEAGALRLEMSVWGAAGEAIADTILFKDGEGVTRMSYGGLVAWDATGRALPTGMTLVEDRLILEVDDRTAVYPLTLDPVIRNEDAKLTASDGVGRDAFATSAVGVSEDIVVVGALGDDDNGFFSGSAYIFVKPVGGWSGDFTENAKLTASDGAANHAFGASVAVSGDTVVIGAPATGAAGNGSTYIFVKPVGGWIGNLQETAKLTASDGATQDDFGRSVAVSGNTVVVGALADDDNGDHSGSAYIFVAPIGGWTGNLTENAKLHASDGATQTRFGTSVAVSGDTVVIGVDAGLSPRIGSAYVFVEPVGGWMGSLQEAAKLNKTAARPGDRFGQSVAVSGDTVVVGAVLDDDNGTNTGSAYVFVKPGGGWMGNLTETAKLNITRRGLRFGSPVAVSGNRIVVAADHRLSKWAYVFVKPVGGWAGSLTEDTEITGSDTDFLFAFGRKVAVSGDTVVIGGGQGGNPGRAYVFDFGPSLIAVDIDIKPGSDPNSINLNSTGNIPVAILGSDTFDTFDVDTVNFGPGGAKPVHGGHPEDVNDDGFMDLVFHFKTQDTGIACSDTTATLTGQTLGGQQISGTDAIRTVGCK